MKKTYNLGGDLFLILAFISFIIGQSLKILGFKELAFGLDTDGLFINAIIFLLFSISLNLNDQYHHLQNK